MSAMAVSRGTGGGKCRGLGEAAVSVTRRGTVSVGGANVDAVTS